MEKGDKKIREMKKLLAILFFIITFSSYAQEKKIILTNGDSLMGTVEQIDETHSRITRSNGSTSIVLASMIKSIDNILMIKMRVIEDSHTLGLQEVLKLDNIKKDELFKKSMLWVSDELGNPKKTVTIDMGLETKKPTEFAIDFYDKETGIIKGIFTRYYYFAGVSLLYKFNFKIEIKDEKARFTIDQISDATPQSIGKGTLIDNYMLKSDGTVKGMQQGVFGRIEKGNNVIYSSFIKSMQKKESDF